MEYTIRHGDYEATYYPEYTENRVVVRAGEEAYNSSGMSTYAEEDITQEYIIPEQIEIKPSKHISP